MSYPTRRARIEAEAQARRSHLGCCGVFGQWSGGFLYAAVASDW